ncbi:hypothetical protein [Burkholderia territorii]|uniref:hypothetical protein n=1 Tax=Burkholderia territorii TaxID=1503055 RepID=UPI0018C6E2C6|nr:hypothetical protein [Burkholderia territorii]
MTYTTRPLRSSDEVATFGILVSGIEVFAGEFAGMAAWRREGTSTHATRSPLGPGCPVRIRAAGHVAATDADDAPTTAHSAGINENTRTARLFQSHFTDATACTRDGRPGIGILAKTDPCIDRAERFQPLPPRGEHTLVSECIALRDRYTTLQNAAHRTHARYLCGAQYTHGET